jgi:hypothetical protein
VQVAVKRAAKPFRRSQTTTMLLDLNDHHLMAIGLSVLSSEAICKT